MSKHPLEVLYYKDYIWRNYPILNILRTLDTDIDKEVILMIDCIERKETHSTKMVSFILKHILPLTPYEWICSKRPLYVLIGKNLKRGISQTSKIGSIIEPIERLSKIYKKYGSMENYCKDNMDKHPQTTIYELLKGKDNTGLYVNYRIARALMMLCRKEDSAGLGIWSLLNSTQLRVPVSRRVKTSLRTIGIKDGFSELEVLNMLSKLCPTDPLKYIPVLDVMLFEEQLNEAGYIM